MVTIIVILFIAGYLGIALEHPIRINKTATALLTGVLCWAVYIVADHERTMVIGGELQHHLAGIAEILFFLLGAMTIVELIDAHQGFGIITRLIRTRNARSLIWIVSLITFFLSAALDNLTTAIVMVSLLRRLVPDDGQRKLFAGMVIIAANAGGAWSPIGDVTTTMLWIGGQISAGNIMITLILPSLACMLVPLTILTFMLPREILGSSEPVNPAEAPVGGKRMLVVGLAVLLFVPVFKTLTHLPPYMGMLLGLGVVWVASEIIHANKDEEERKPYTAVHALSRIDSSSMLFFLGILVAIGALESTHVLTGLARWMDRSIGDYNLISINIGLLSAVVDNVPLVAASTGMYPLASEIVNPEAYQYALQHPELIHEGIIVFNGSSYFLRDAKIWEFIAYAAGTGGSCLIIGSAAGVAVMGMEKINFLWYLRKIGWLALTGFLAGALCYMGVYSWFAVYN